MLKKFKLLCVLLMAIIFSVTAQADAAPNWNTGTISVTGMGVPNPNMATTPAHASMMARRAAIADAYRQLAEAVNGVNVDAETTVEQMMLTSDVVKTRVNAVIRGARITSEGELAGGGYSVTMEIGLFGDNGLAETVIERPAAIEPIPVPPTNYQPPAYEPTPPPAFEPNPQPKPRKGNYTGLIVDCRGLGTLNPVMSPVVKNANGQKIYGHKNLDYDRIILEGMANYAADMSQAGRAGSNPLVIHAIGLDDFNANPVLSNEDADFVLYENSQTHFLENIAVVFLY